MELGSEFYWFILIGLGVFWILSHRSHGRCAPTSKRYSTG